MTISSVASTSTHDPPSRNEPLARFGAALKRHMTLEDLISLEACLGCRQCGTACAWFLETSDDARHPLHRKRLLQRIYRRQVSLLGRLGCRVGAIQAPSEGELSASMEAFWKCTNCGRCTLACPLSLSNRSLFRLARTAYAESGLSAQNATRRAIIDNTRDRGNSFGTRPEQTLLRLAFHLAISHTDAPLDRAGSEFLLVAPTVDAERFPEHLFRLVQLLNASGIRYTLSSRVMDLGTEIDHVVVDHDLARRMLTRVEAEAEYLGVKTLLIPECGCDVRTFYGDAPGILGRALRVGVKWVDTVILEQLESGRLPSRPAADCITLHDPCQITRLSGMGGIARRILRHVAPEYVEMTPHGSQNYCCNGSSGPMRLPENAELRRRVSSLKARQIEGTHASIVVSPCAVCTLTLNDICQTYGLARQGERMARMLYEVVHASVVSALVDTPAENGLFVPDEVHPDASGQSLTLSAWVEELRTRPIYSELYAWLLRDISVARVLETTGRARLVLEAMAPERRTSMFVGGNEDGETKCIG